MAPISVIHHREANHNTHPPALPRIYIFDPYSFWPFAGAIYHSALPGGIFTISHSSAPQQDPHLFTHKLNYPAYNLLFPSEGGKHGYHEFTRINHFCHIAGREFRVSWDLGTCIPGCITWVELSFPIRSHFLFFCHRWSRLTVGGLVLRPVSSFFCSHISFPGLPWATVYIHAGVARVKADLGRCI